MELAFEASTAAIELAGLLGRVSANPSVKSLLVLSAGVGLTPEAADPILRSQRLPLFGGNFPLVLHGGQAHAQATIVVGLTSEAKTQVVRGLDDAEANLERAVESVTVTGSSDELMFVILDGLARRGTTLLSALVNVIGLDIGYVGGGAGAMDLRQRPCIFTNEGFLQSAAVLATLETPHGFGIRHGMKSVAGPFRVTRVTPGGVAQLDGLPALAQLLEAASAHSGQKLLPRETPPVLDDYAIAVNRLGGEMIVREALWYNPEGELMVGPEMREGELVHVVHTTKQDTIAAATEALSLAQERFPAESSQGLVVTFDCSGRWRYLGEDFEQEAQALQVRETPVVGALTLAGEIANTGTDFLEYHNRTCVVAMLRG